MKKILPLLLLILFSCEKAEMNNDIVGTKWTWIGTKSPGSVKVQNDEGGYDTITFQSTQYASLHFFSNDSLTYKMWEVGGPKEYMMDYSTGYSYTFNSRTKQGQIRAIEVVGEWTNETITPFELSDDGVKMYSDLGDFTRSN